MNYTTNRILEIPQDIKLELNNGTLTLKAGSKVYIPNGFETDGTTPKFDSVTIETDKSLTGVSDVVEMCFHNPYDAADWPRLYVPSCYSGASAPSGAGYMFWYDTSTNLIKLTKDGGSSWESGYSLPFAIIKEQVNSIESVDSIFNGFGFIGSTIFALPGVKCQFADGRNTDGSYKSYVATTTEVLTKTFGSETYNGFDTSLSCENGNITGFAWHGNEDFNAESGYIEINKSGVIQENICPVLRFFINSSADNGRISQFLPKEVDKLNWKTSDISGMSMPSSKYIDLTLGASGTTYTAPANGWFTVDMHGTAGALFGFQNDSAGLVTFISQLSTETDRRVSCPAKKGDIVRIYLNQETQKVYFFRFVYAEGDQ